MAKVNWRRRKVFVVDFISVPDPRLIITVRIQIVKMKIRNLEYRSCFDSGFFP
jgi:hypothetical protein